jgi:hypothetical protein
MSGNTSGGERVARLWPGSVADAFLLIPTFTVNGMTAPPSRGGIPVFPVPSACGLTRPKTNTAQRSARLRKGYEGPSGHANAEGDVV